MKRIKCLSVLLTLALLFCMGTANAQSKVAPVEKQVENVQMSKSKTTTNTNTPATTRNGRVSGVQSKRVASQQSLKAATPSEFKARTTSGNQAKNVANGAKLIQVQGIAKVSPVSPMQLNARGQGQGSGHIHKTTRVSKTPQKSAPQSTKKID